MTLLNKSFFRDSATKINFIPNKQMLFSYHPPSFKLLTSLPKTRYYGVLGPMQKIIMLCGPPGAGKGMYSSMLARDFGYIKISTGDEIRRILNGMAATTLSQKVIANLKRTMAQGKLISDEIVMEIVYRRIKDPESSRGVILDGFPRTVSQLEMFTQVLPIHLVVNIEQSYDYLMASILGRRTCMRCGTSYSAYSFYKDGYELDVQMPRKSGICDHCEGKVTTRPDDKAEVVRARLKEYETKTYPMLKEMKDAGLLVSFEAKRGERDYPKLQQIIVSKLGLPYYHFQSYYREYNNRTAWY